MPKAYLIVWWHLISAGISFLFWKTLSISTSFLTYAIFTFPETRLHSLVTVDNLLLMLYLHYHVLTVKISLKMKESRQLIDFQSIRMDGDPQEEHIWNFQVEILQETKSTWTLRLVHHKHQYIRIHLLT